METKKQTKCACERVGACTLEQQQQQLNFCSSCCCCHSNTPIDPSNTTQHRWMPCLDLTWLDLSIWVGSKCVCWGPAHDWALLSTSNSLLAKTSWLVCASVYIKIGPIHGPRFCPSKEGKGKSQRKGEKSSNKIMRDNGIMVFLWRFFLALGNRKKN